MTQSIGFNLSAFGDSRPSVAKLVPLFEQDIQFDPAQLGAAEGAIHAIESRLDEYAKTLGNTAAVQAIIAVLKLQVREHIVAITRNPDSNFTNHSE